MKLFLTTFLTVIAVSSSQSVLDNLTNSLDDGLSNVADAVAGETGAEVETSSSAPLSADDITADTNACESVPCQNGGVCEDGTGDEYKCTCQPGFAGDNCEYDICSFGVCLNNGECTVDTSEDNSFKFACTCPTTHTGMQC